MFAALILAAAVAIPNNFLLYEKAAATRDDNPETSWSASGKKPARLVVDPCQNATLGQSGRTAARTLTYTSVPDYSKSEQVILYSSPAAAGKALRDLQTAVRACGTTSYRYSATTVSLGDQALKVIGQAYQGKKAAVGGERAIVARRANALIVYTASGEWGRPAASDFKQQTKDARRMLAKICTIADC
ncbi:sensor domain-containing protein [Nonomuraea turkmeniaca]|uniref:Sensor domain-containing protein n=1 Tax=Nonomuraea turkmeniaca TaxID=103838 RepID=A0A5S4EYR8_9ACTN|nr:sensor domain-containing protein [Nonomuraea turkmeniaca]TMR08849.1 sensor domain-containing protein [Nonomuraea turkmeniaca]